MSDDLVKIGNSALNALPDHLKGVSGHEGTENTRKKDLILPRLSVCQDGNPQRKKQNPLYIEGLDAGMFFNSVTGEVYGDSVQFIPLTKTGQQIYFRDLKEGGGIICRSLNGIDGGTLSPTCETCPNYHWGAKGETPLCTEFMNFPALLIQGDFQQLILLSWKSTALKPARTWYTKANALVERWNKPLFAWVTQVQLRPDKKDGNDFFVPAFTLKRWADTTEFNKAQQKYNDLKGVVIAAVDDQAEPGTLNEEDIPF